MQTKCEHCEEWTGCDACTERDAKDRQNVLTYYYGLARDGFDEHLEYQDSDEDREAVLDEPGDAVHEVADGCVPVYTNDLLQLAANCQHLAVDEPELGPAFDGTPTPTNIIAANVYEAIQADLYEYVEELKKEAEEEDDEEA